MSMPTNNGGRPRKYVTDDAVLEIADALALIGFMPDRVRMAKALVPLLAGLTCREPASIAAAFRDAYVARRKAQWRVLGLEWEENEETAKIWGERYFSSILGLNVGKRSLSQVV